MKPTQYIGYIGTYTKGESKGIYTFLLDTEEEKINEVQVAAELENPTYLTLSEDNQFLYSVVKDGENGGVAAFTVSMTLTELNRQVSPGSPPCHVAVGKDNYLLSSNYHKGTVSAFSLKNGTIDSELSTIQHGEPGIAHTHYASFTPDGNYIVVVELGLDKIFTYELVNEKLTEVNSLEVRAGSGPRHLSFHPNQNFAYVMTEFSSEVIVLHYQNGQFTPIQTISTIPDDFTENNQGSAIKVSADGRFVYAGNRGHNSIAVFHVNPETNQLSFVEYTSTEGNWPRDFELDPSERYIVASNQESNNLVLYSRNPETGKLQLLQSDIHVPNPVCVKFLGACHQPSFVD